MINAPAKNEWQPLPIQNIFLIPVPAKTTRIPEQFLELYYIDLHISLLKSFAVPTEPILSYILGWCIITNSNLLFGKYMLWEQHGEHPWESTGIFQSPAQAYDYKFAWKH